MCQISERKAAATSDGHLGCTDTLRIFRLLPTQELFPIIFTLKIKQT